MVIKILPILLGVFIWTGIIIFYRKRKEKKNYKESLRTRYRKFDKGVNNIDTLFTCIYPGEVGCVVEVSETDKCYILEKSIFTDKYLDPWQRWKHCPDLKRALKHEESWYHDNSIEDLQHFTATSNISAFNMLNSNKYLLYRYPNKTTFQTVVSGIVDREILWGTLLAISRHRDWDIGSVILDTSVRLWQVLEIKAGKNTCYNFSTGESITLTDDEIYGRVIYSWGG